MCIGPGGETKCIFETSTPYQFEVVLGDLDKVYVHFQGGGACWDELSTDITLCTTDASPYGAVGIFDRKNPNNKYANYTIIQALYCSGDVWGGNITQPYTHRGGSVVQVGAYNAEATISYLAQQQAAGFLAPTLSELVIGGDSAGSIGAQLWGTFVLDALKWDKAAILPDSYACVFPEGSVGPLVKSLGACNTNWIPQSLLPSCLNETLDFQALNNYFLGLYPTIPRGFIQSKTDITQESFYVAVGFTYAPGSSTLHTNTVFYNYILLTGIILRCRGCCDYAYRVLQGC